MMRKNDELCVTGLNCPFLNGLWGFFCARRSLHPLCQLVIYFFGINFRNISDLLVQFNIWHTLLSPYLVFLQVGLV
jgi:hypothetical protein